ncbi:hypothetical protein ACS0TY_032090 [Phlomoides rotata]
MEGELHNLIMVWCLNFISSYYCYGTTKLIPKGTIRFFFFLPVICLSFHLPLQLNTIGLSNPTAFFVTWQTTFKLLLLVFGNGPLSNPSLSFIHFLVIYCLPFTLQDGPAQNQKPNSNKIGLTHYARNAFLFIFLIYLGNYKDKFPRDVVLFLICIYVYVGLEVMLVGVAFVAQISLGGAQIDPPFDHPYLATSFQDFWGRRWNRVASTSLRSTIFQPTFNYTRQALGRKWAGFLALMVSFMVSDVMHEIQFYYLGRVRFGRGPPTFFLLHGLLVAFESMLKRKMDVKWKIPQTISGPLIFGFVICSFMWLVLPELLELNADDRVLKEYAAFVTFLKGLGRF